MDEFSDLVLIDVWILKEFINGYFDFVRNIDYFGDDFYEQIEVLDFEQKYFVYCWSGCWSICVCILMINGGMVKDNVYNLDGGW